MTFQERNGTRGMKPEHSGWNLAKKIRKGPRFKIRWKLFCFILFFELVWNVSAIPDETEQNWQSWFVVVDKFFFSKSIFFLILIFYFAYWIYGIFNISRWLSNKKKDIQIHRDWFDEVRKKDVYSLRLLFWLIQ